MYFAVENDLSLTVQLAERHSDINQAGRLLFSVQSWINLINASASCVLTVAFYIH